MGPVIQGFAISLTNGVRVGSIQLKNPQTNKKTCSGTQANKRLVGMKGEISGFPFPYGLQSPMEIHWFMMKLGP